MNNYIIDPSVFYWMNTLQTIKEVLWFLFVALFIFGIGLTIWFVYQKHEIPERPEKPNEPKFEECMDNSHRDHIKWRYTQDMDQYDLKLRRYYDAYKKARRCKRAAVYCLIAAFAFILPAIFIPSKETSIEMLVAKTATFDNVDWTVQQVKEVVDYIVRAIQSAV